MGERVRIERLPDGRLLAIKAPAGAGRDLAAEAEVLRRAQVPGVVELVAPQPGGRRADGTAAEELATRWVGPRTLADVAPPLDPVRAAGLCLSIAGTLGRLHRSGVVHGALDPSHVLLDGQGRPVLCGFGAAEVLRRGSTLRPADDVAGLARLLTHLLGADDERQGIRRSSGRRERNQLRVLLTLTAAAAVDDPSCRPSLAAFVHGVRRAVPAAHLGTDDPTAPDRPSRPPARTSPASRPAFRPRPGRRRTPAHAAPRPSRPADPLRAALALAGLVAVGATTWFGLTAWHAGSTPAPASAPLAASEPTRLGTSTTAVAASTSTTEPPSTPSPPPLAPAPAPVVEHDGRRFEVGEPGDVALVGPWFCDGIDVVALLRPSSGAVHVFTSWAPVAGTAEARAVATLPGATELAAVADGPGCAVLVVGSPTATLRTLTAEDLR